MMEYTDDDWVGTSIDWYAVDGNGNIACFASCGYPLPPSVKSDKEKNRRLHTLFDNVPVLTNNFLLTYRKRKTFPSFFYEEVYANNLKDDASRGLYVYYPILVDGHYDEQYYCAIIPQKRLNINELPPDIQEILNRTRWKKGTFDEYPIIDLREIE